MMNVATSVLSRVHPVPARRHHRAVAAPRGGASCSSKTRRRFASCCVCICLWPASRSTRSPTARAALERARADRFDLIVLDVMVPGLDGITLCRAIRSQSVNTASAVLMLTARDSEADKVLGLESGADDYLTKPFGVREMVARVGAILRRNERIDAPAGAAAPRHVRSRDVTLDPERREAIVRGRPVELTQAGIRSALPARGASRHRLQPRRAADEGLDRRHLRHRADRRHGDQPAAPQDRARRAEPGADPHRLGRRLQVRRRRLMPRLG